MTMKWHQGAGGNSENDVEWKPEGPDQLTGVLTSKRSVTTKYGPTTILKIESATDGVEYTVWCSRSGLKSLVEQYDEDLIVGREVGIKTDGKTTLPDGNTFFPYEIGFGEFRQGAANVVGADEPF